MDFNSRGDLPSDEWVETFQIGDKRESAMLYGADFEVHPLIQGYYTQLLRLQRTHVESAVNDLYASLVTFPDSRTYEQVYHRVYDEACALVEADRLLRMGYSAEDMMIHVCRTFQQYENLAAASLRKVGKGWTARDALTSVHSSILRLLSSPKCYRSLFFLPKVGGPPTFPNGYPLNYSTCKMSKSELEKRCFLVEIRTLPVREVDNEELTTSQTGIKILYWCTMFNGEKAKLIPALKEALKNNTVAFKMPTPGTQFTPRRESK
jgi:hypothetical protein